MRPPVVADHLEFVHAYNFICESFHSFVCTNRRTRNGLHRISCWRCPRPFYFWLQEASLSGGYTQAARPCAAPAPRSLEQPRRDLRSLFARAAVLPAREVPTCMYPLTGLLTIRQVYCTS